MANLSPVFSFKNNFNVCVFALFHARDHTLYHGHGHNPAFYPDILNDDKALEHTEAEHTPKNLLAKHNPSHNHPKTICHRAKYNRGQDKPFDKQNVEVVAANVFQCELKPIGLGFQY
jgi:hypothetical protein